ncbi:MAG TPA: hypothetical protein VGY58_15990 [Gemmataceae bacterium]|nr:hypothetical protein [Gemmataceae bacterium]
MIRSTRQCTLAVMAGLLTLGPGALAARAQSRTQTSTPSVRVNPSTGAGTTPFPSSPIWNIPRATPGNPGASAAFNPALPSAINPGAAAAFNPALASPANPLAAAAYNGALLSGQTNPYASSTAAYGANGSSYGSGYGGYYETETGGFLRGTADIVNSQGKWLVSLQQASLLKEQVRQAALETRRKQLDQYVSERQQTPTFAQARESSSNQQLLRSLNNPPESEVLSGQALNDILDDLAKTDEPAARGPAATLDENLLRHINLASGRSTASAALLKNDGRLTWPSALLDEGSKEDRLLINSLAPAARGQAVSGTVESGTLRELTAASQRLRQKLSASAKDLTATQYIDASRFMGQLDDAIRVLSRPDAGDYITSKSTAEGKNVAELVLNMSAKGLRFAPATPGDETAYLALHRALVIYDGARSQVASDRAGY